MYSVILGEQVFNLNAKNVKSVIYCCSHYIGIDLLLFFPLNLHPAFMLERCAMTKKKKLLQLNKLILKF